MWIEQTVFLKAISLLKNTFVYDYECVNSKYWTSNDYPMNTNTLNAKSALYIHLCNVDR